MCDSHTFEVRRTRRVCLPVALDAEELAPTVLALAGAPGQALANLERLRRNFDDLYGQWGFRDSVNVDSGVVSDSAQKMPPVCSHRDPSVPKISSQSTTPGWSWAMAV